MSRILTANRVGRINRFSESDLGGGNGSSSPFTEQYYQKVSRLTGSSLVAHWPGWEPSGTVATAINNAALNGVYSGVTLGQVGIGDGRTSGLYVPASNSRITPPAAYLAAFPRTAGSLLIAMRARAESVWTDGISRAIFHVASNDLADRFYIVKTATNNTIRLSRKAGATQKTVDTIVSGLNWILATLTWDEAADQVRCYINQNQVGSTLTSIGAAVATIGATYSYVGWSNTGTVAESFDGYEAHAVTVDRALTPTEVTSISAGFF